MSYWSIPPGQPVRLLAIVSSLCVLLRFVYVRCAQSTSLLFLSFLGATSASMTSLLITTMQKAVLKQNLNLSPSSTNAPSIGLTQNVSSPKKRPNFSPKAGAYDAPVSHLLRHCRQRWHLQSSFRRWNGRLCRGLGRPFGRHIAV